MTTTIQHDYTYASALADSLKVNWRIEDLLGDHEELDFSRPFLPDSLAGVEGIAALTPADKLVLNQIRGKTYLYLFGFVEEFILPFVLEQAREAVHDDSARVRSLVTFAEEEAKHIDLFRRFSVAFDRGFHTRIDVIGPAEEVAKAILAHSPLGIVLTILHLEWLTQKHYLDAVKSQGAALEPRFVSLLKHHWQEESQHAKVDTLLAAEIVKDLAPAEIAVGIDDYLKIAGLLDGGLVAQVSLDLDALERHRGHAFSASQRAEIVAAQTRSYRHTFLVAGAVHASFTKILAQISPRGQEQVAAVVAALSS